MRSWIDRHGGRHDVEFDFGLVRRVARDVGLDVARVLESDAQTRALYEFLGRPENVVAVLAVVESVDDAEEFAALFDGDALEKASEALLGAIIDFFPERQRLIHSRLLQSLTEWRKANGAEQEAAILQAIEKVDWCLVVSGLATFGNGSDE